MDKSDKTFNFADLKLEAYDEERQIWCRVIELDCYTNDTIGLNNGYVSFWRKLSEVKLRSPLIK
jgi:hypothetical protein